MRDIIWTLIIIWLLYKVVGFFKGTSANKSQTDKSNLDQHQSSHTNTSDQEIKSAVKKHLNNEGEYVDFEEIK